MLIAHFLTGHWLDLILAIVIFFVFTLDYLPATWAGMQRGYFDEKLQKTVLNPKQSLLAALTNAIFFTSLKSALITIGFKGATSIVLFTVIGVDLVSHGSLSNNAVIMAIVGIVAYISSRCSRTQKRSVLHTFSGIVAGNSVETSSWSP